MGIKNDALQGPPAQSRCFDTCTCNCGAEGQDFDQVLTNETKLSLSMHTLAHSNMGWFVGSHDPTFKSWGISNTIGVYLLWEKDDYCPTHNMFHCRALYIGKGAVQARIWKHSLEKRKSQHELTYFSCVFMENRHAKYIEQLVLDLYDLPLNSAENPGKKALCSYISQTEADFGS